MINWNGLIIGAVCGVGYILFGSWIGMEARRAWIFFLRRAVQRMPCTNWRDNLSPTFIFLFPYTALTGRITTTWASFLFSVDNDTNELDRDGKIYVWLHALFWPIRLALQVATFCAAMRVFWQARKSPEERLSELDARHRKLDLQKKDLEAEMERIRREQERLIAEKPADAPPKRPQIIYLRTTPRHAPASPSVPPTPSPWFSKSSKPTNGRPN